MEFQSDADVKELHSWGLKESRTNGGVNHTRAEATESPLDKEEKRGALSDKVDLISEFTSSRDTPRDMAEYIFWTGDEKSVTSAIKDFVEQGLVNMVSVSLMGPGNTCPLTDDPVGRDRLLGRRALLSDPDAAEIWQRRRCSGSGRLFRREQRAPNGAG